MEIVLHGKLKKQKSIQRKMASPKGIQLENLVMKGYCIKLSYPLEFVHM